MEARIKGLLRQVIGVVRWYTTPTGLVTLAVIVAALVAAAASRPALGLGIVVVWLAVVLPYQFTGERYERIRAAEVTATDHVTRIANLEASVARLASEVVMSPTLAETESWLERLADRPDPHSVD